MVFLQAMDLVNEQHVAFFQIGQQAGEIGGLLDGRAAGGLLRLPPIALARMFAMVVCPNRAGREQDVIERLAALLGGGDGNLQPLL